MKVKTIMTHEIASCSAGDSLFAAAQRMWDYDCGFLPVLDIDSGRLQGVVTDRDLCMAALRSARPLGELRVGEAMARDILTCSPDDDLRDVHAAMREAQVRRMPVVDEDCRVIGIVSLNDLAVEAFASRGAAAYRRQREVAKTLAAICRHREPAPLALSA